MPLRNIQRLWAGRLHYASLFGFKLDALATANADPSGDRNVTESHFFDHKISD